MQVCVCVRVRVSAVYVLWFSSYACCNTPPQLCPLLLRAMRFERSFSVLLRVYRAVSSFVLELGPLLPTECEVCLAALADAVEAGATIVDSLDPDTTYVTKSRFGSAGARIVADAHRMLSERARDDDDTGHGRVVLPKLVLVLECWSMLTSRPDFLRHTYVTFDASPDRAKVGATLGLWG